MAQVIRACFEELTAVLHGHGAGGFSGDLSIAVSEYRSLLMAVTDVCGSMLSYAKGLETRVSRRSNSFFHSSAMSFLGSALRQVRVVWV